MSAPETVPCGIHTMGEPRTEHGWLTSYPCGGTCRIVETMETLVYYECERCGHGTARRSDGSPLPGWDGLLRDGTPYEDSAVDEHSWLL
jgi:hypothetical protein